jgi:large subunit ribosomal protein L4
MKIEIYNQKGDVAKTMELPKEVFQVEVKEELIHQALIRQLANSRHAIAHTQTKGEVSGGGKKPFRQKGTGNARQGSITNPHFIGGGVAFGPRNTRNFELDMPKKQRRKALLMALSIKAQESKIFGLESYEDKDAKTRNMAELIAKLPVKRNVLMVLPATDALIKKVTKNLPNVKTITAPYLNIHDLQKYDSVCFVGEGVQKTKDTFTNTK